MLVHWNGNRLVLLLSDLSLFLTFNQATRSDGSDSLTDYYLKEIAPTVATVI